MTLVGRSRSSMATPLILAGLFALAITVLSGCTSDSLFPESRVAATFDDYTAFSTDADVVFRAQKWVPEDATAIATDAYASKPGNMLGFTSASSVTSPECVAGDLTGKPPFETAWWPSTEPVAGLVCGDWQVFNEGSRWYAWTE